jgi:hypothetical protein
VLGVQSAGIQLRGQFTEECFRLVHLILAQSTPHLWFRILPVDGKDDDICVGTGVEWKYLLPLLTKCGLLRSLVTSVVKDIRCDHSQWDEMAKSFVSHMKMEITCIRTWNSRRSYFYCIGKPLYKSPIVQEQALVTKGLPNKKHPPQIINEFVIKTSQNVINQQLAFRIQPNPVPPMNDEQIDVVANTIMDAINYAAALDLDRRPRLSRTNAGK